MSGFFNPGTFGQRWSSPMVLRVEFEFYRKDLMDAFEAAYNGPTNAVLEAQVSPYWRGGGLHGVGRLTWTAPKPARLKFVPIAIGRADNDGVISLVQAVVKETLNVPILLARETEPGLKPYVAEKGAVINLGLDVANKNGIILSVADDQLGISLSQPTRSLFMDDGLPAIPWWLSQEVEPGLSDAAMEQIQAILARGEGVEVAPAPAEESAAAEEAAEIPDTSAEPPKPETGQGDAASRSERSEGPPVPERQEAPVPTQVPQRAARIESTALIPPPGTVQRESN